MGDTFDQANTEIQAQKAAMLQAMAQGGTEGARQLQAAQDQIAQQRGTAVSSALQEAINRGAPQGLIDQMNQTISSPYNNQIASLTASEGSRSATQAALQAANSSYFDQAAAAIPSLRTYAAAKAAENAQKQQSDAIDMQLKQLELQSRQADLQAKLAGGGLSDSQLKTRLSGQGQVARQSISDVADSLPDIPGLTSGLKALLSQGAAGPSDQEYARGQGIAAGLDPSLVYGLTTDAKSTKTPLGKSSPNYLNPAKAWQGAGPHALAVLHSVVNGSKTPQQALDNLYAGAPGMWTPSANGKPTGPSLSGGQSLDLNQMAAWLRSYYGLA